MINSTPQAVTIAGSDSGGGAGIQADLKTFQARNVFGMSIVVALTAQNTKGVQDAYYVPTEFIDAQFDSLADDFKIGACKTGMLASEAHVKCVVENLKRVDFGPYILDPVMIAKGGHKLLEDGAIDSIKSELVPLATVITPNIPEAEVLTGLTIQSGEDMVEAANYLKALGAENVIIKGGHRDDSYAEDFVSLKDKEFWMRGTRIDTNRTHGTGDTFAACIASELAKGNDLKTSIITAKSFIQSAIEEGIEVGHGHGPVNHWAEVKNSIEIIEK
ncbi:MULTISPECIES: bifunctional hydroxymethylpyrimidine kinase/phosphomethylpyrimidine kinase [unclassified Nosocomiicoccus]|uniref:bifunctional hydroxymethylpyrimidine kinase/phosphomethylpyrimidine kinase n=1 Tax=unclassified Nosocomiicoccus TaxID=2646683 RepID=UPI0008A3BAC3|nr:MULTISPECIES: bifunctional hydroxymethylpyrimidine kinase/phosphomethylpyrimidine kinase [unclassified Nosocomiicoccus]OFL48318.1 hydroxymethylpyrimidine/phosphomethylpyrimidine kinase [Nosocomiicoccus sp. HMSC067E10]OFO49433.1 hydroxymethylpyrimidine/phosphomethylpyrimidine kinase [Nosocomiicoccus sp. HMSC059G07]OFS63163.1 hydroxymethylpyrimidine/phosphomethylpyrimidine kinase [Nosocomiicoccus sp. HMSC09A07]